MMKFCLIFLVLCLCNETKAADTPPCDSTKKYISVSGYLEAYYGYYIRNQLQNEMPVFIYSYHRHNEVNINLGYVKLSVDQTSYRANFALMAGTYPNTNLASEPGVLKHIFEANLGIKLSKKYNLWIDAGVFPSHIGFESAIGMLSATLTRTIMADNSPYYESGAKTSYTSANGKWQASVLFLNGWQRIQRVKNNNTPAFGHQLTYKPTDKITLNSSSFVGSDVPDSVRQMRYFHNYYSIIEPTVKLSFIAGIDLGAQQKSKHSTEYNYWLAAVVVAKYNIGNHASISARAEYYADNNEVIVKTPTQNGFQTVSYSCNIDIHIGSNMLWRIEAKSFFSKQAIFADENESSYNNHLVITALCVNI